VRGFPKIMPTFKGRLSDDDVAAIIAYLKTLSDRETEGKEKNRERKGKNGRGEREK
jgi:mono/diheme cytochrome c family protein